MEPLTVFFSTQSKLYGQAALQSYSDLQLVMKS